MCGGVEYVQGDQWRVVDSHEQVVFTGTKEQVEDWLDHLENVQRQPSPRTSLWAPFRQFLQSLRRFASELTRKPTDVRAD
jgi:hypothetical protein